MSQAVKKLSDFELAKSNFRVQEARYQSLLSRKATAQRQAEEALRILEEVEKQLPLAEKWYTNAKRRLEGYGSEEEQKKYERIVMLEEQILALGGVLAHRVQPPKPKCQDQTFDPSKVYPAVLKPVKCLKCKHQDSVLAWDPLLEVAKTGKLTCPKCGSQLNNYTMDDDDNEEFKEHGLT